MTKKILKTLLFIFITFLAFSSLNLSYAKELNSLNELGEEILAINPDAEYAYVIGNYVFTSGHELTTQDVMLAARSITTSENAGKTNRDSIYGEMTIYTIERTFNENAQPTGWKVGENLVGNSKFKLNEANKIDINYVDYNYAKYNYKVTLNYGYEGAENSVLKVVEGNKVTQPQAPERTGYKFIGWYIGDKQYNFNTPVTENITLTAKWKLVVDLNNIIDTSATKINTDRYEVTRNGKDVTVTVQNVARDHKLLEGGSQVLTVLSEVLANENIQTVTLTAEGMNEALVMDKADKNLTSTIKTWLDTYATNVLNKNLNEATNEDFVGKTLTVEVKMTEGAVSAEGNVTETYTMAIAVEDYETVDLNNVIDTSATKINTDKYEVTRNGKDVTVTVQNVARDHKLLEGGSQVLTVLSEVLANENIQTVTLTAEGMNEALVMDKADKNLTSTIKTWLDTYATNVLNKNLNEATNEDFAGKTLTVEVKMTEGAVSAEGNVRETYTMAIAVEDYETVDLNNVIDTSATKINTDRYEVTRNGKDVTVTVQNVARDHKLLEGGSQVLTVLSEVLANENIQTVTLTAEGMNEALVMDKADKNLTSTIKTWLDTYAANVLNKNLNEATNEDFAGKTLTVEVKMTEGAVSAEGNVRETYTMAIAVEDYETVDLNNLIDTSATKINTDRYEVTRNGKDVTVTVQNVARDHKLLEGGSQVLTVLSEVLANENIQTITLTAEGMSEALVMDKADGNLANTIKTWLDTYAANVLNKNLNEATNEDFAGKTLTVKVKMTEETISTEGKKLETYNMKIEAEPYEEVNVNDIIDTSATKINTDKYVLTRNGKDVTVTVQNVARGHKLLEGGSQVLTVLSEVLANENIQALTLTAEGLNEALVMDKADGNLANTIKTWLDTYAANVLNKNLNEATNEDFAGKTLTVEVKMTQEAISTEGNATETYTMAIVAEDYETVDVNNLIDTSATKINTDKYVLTRNEGNVTVTVQNVARGHKLLEGGSQVLTVLSEVLANENIQTMTLTAEGMSEALVMDKADGNLVNTIKTWLDTYATNVLNKNLNEATNEDFAGKTLTVEVKMTEDALSAEGNVTETYTMAIVAEDYETVDVNNLIDTSATKIDTNKYVLTRNEGNVTVTVQNVARNHKLLEGGSQVLTVLSEVLANENIQTMTLTAEGMSEALVMDKADKNLTSTIKTWLDTYATNVLNKNLNEATNEDFVGKTLTVEVKMTEGALSTIGNKLETYSMRIEAEPYEKVNVNNLIDTSVAKLATDVYNIERNEKDVTVTVQNVARDHKLLESGSQVLSVLSEVLANENIQTVTLTAEGMSKTLVMDKADKSLTSTIKTWLDTYATNVLNKNLNEATNEDFAGKTLTVKVKMTEGALSVEGNATETYTMTVTAEPYEEVNVNELVDAKIAQIDNSIYDISRNGENVKVTVQKAARTHSLKEDGLQIFTALSDVLANENIQTITLTAEGMNEALVMDRADGDLANTIKTWLNTYAANVLNKNLNEAKNEDFGEKQLTVKVKMTDKAISAEGNKIETYKMKIEVVPYTVTFVYNNGTENHTENVAKNGKVTKPENPTYEGNRFEGWYIGEAKYDFSTIATEDVILNAKWKKIIDVDSYIKNNVVANTRNDFEAKFNQSEKTVDYGIFIKVGASGAVPAGEKLTAVTGTNYAKGIYNALTAGYVKKIFIDTNEFSLETVNSESETKNKLIQILAESANKDKETATIKDLIGKTYTIKIELDETKAILDTTTGKTKETYTINIQGVTDIFAIQDYALRGINGQGNFKGVRQENIVNIDILTPDKNIAFGAGLSGTGVKSSMQWFLKEGNGIESIVVKNKLDQTKSVKIVASDVTEENAMSKATELMDIFPSVNVFSKFGACDGEQVIVEINLSENCYVKDGQYTTYTMVFTDPAKK